MVFPNRRFVRAVGLMIGSIVGVGVFGLPFAFAQTGYGIGLLVLLVLGGMNAILLLMYADIVLHTPGNHRMAGYIAAYLGPTWGKVGIIGLAVSIWGGMAAYLIAGGRFLGILFGADGGMGETALGILLLCVVAAVSYRGLKFASRIEVGILGLLMFLLAFIVVSAIPDARVANLVPLHWDRWLLAYGVVFFAFNGGINAIPEMRAVLGSDRRLPHAVMTGMLWVLGLYAIFTLAVVAATGTGTSPFAIDALVPSLGDTFRVVGSALAVVSVFSIFLLTSIALRHAFERDVGLRKNAAWLLVFLPPAIAYLLGLRSFIGLLGFFGSVVSAAIGILIVATYESMRSSKACRDHACVEFPRAFSAIIAGCYALGIVLTMIHALA